MSNPFADLSPSGRLALVEELLYGPRVEEECPTCGHIRIVRGAPLISRELAMKLIDAPGLLEDRREPPK